MSSTDSEMLQAGIKTRLTLRHTPKPSLRLNVSSGINAYVLIIVCLHFEIGYRSAQFLSRALHYMSGNQ